MDKRLVRRLGYLVIGALAGLVVGAIVAVNLMIVAGTDRGYEASLSELFEESPLVGVLTVSILIAGPVVGILVANRKRKNTETR